MIEPPITPITGGKALKTAEWMAENAYIAPGFHRLLAAGGLTLGLLGGRSFMDVLTARNGATGEEIPRSRTPEIIRPLHGLMRYNPYSDNPADRWKSVIDKMAPVAFGSVGVYLGASHYFHGRGITKEPFFAAGEAVSNAIKSGKYSTDTSDAMLRLLQSDTIRKASALPFTLGASAGPHIVGAAFPGNAGLIAISFQKGAGRSVGFPGLGWLNRLLGNHAAGSKFMYGANRDVMTWMATNIAHFDSAERWVEPKMLQSYVQNALQNFRDLPMEQVENVTRAFHTMIEGGYAHVAALKKAGASQEAIREQALKFLNGSQHPEKIGMVGPEFDRLLHKSGVDLSKVSLAKDAFSVMPRMFSKDPERAVLKAHAEYLNKNFGYTLDPKKWAEQQLEIHPWKITAAYGSALATLGGSLALASHAHHRLHSHTDKRHKPLLSEKSLTLTDAASAAKQEQANDLLSWANGKPLDLATWLSRVLITPPSMHRFMNAAYLSATLYGSVKLANVVTGRKLTKLNAGVGFIEKTMEDGGKLKTLVDHSALTKDKVWGVFKPLHGVLSYTPGSAELKDRWRQAAHFLFPVGVGMFGTFAGSHYFFADRIKSLKNPDTLEDYADKITLEQSKPFAAATALTSIFNTGSGIHLLPVFSYSSNLNNRYLMASGQQVAMPGIGEWWSGNAGTTPWGVKRTLRQIRLYLTHNPYARPRELSALVHSLIGKLYPQLTEDQLLEHKQTMLDRICEVRDSFLVEGHVPESKKAALGESMKTLLTGVGFEELLRASDLDPAKADLAHNGASGAIANFLGEKGKVEQLKNEYREKYAARIAAQKAGKTAGEIADAKPADFLRSLLDNGPARPSVNDNRPQSFTERAHVESKQGGTMEM